MKTILTKLEKQVIELTSKTNLVPFLKGPHGIGKTSFVKSLAEKLDKTLVIFNLSAVDAADLTGLPINRDNKNGSFSLVYSRPSFLDADIIFFDELDRLSSRDVKAALNSLFVDRSINGHSLRPDQVLIAAGNQDSERYEVNDFDDSFRDRLAFIDFKVSTKDRLNYFKASLGETNPMTLFFESRVEVFETFSPRRLFQAASLFVKFDKNEDQSKLDLVEIVLNRETKKVFESFLFEGLINLEDLKKGKLSPEKLSPLARASCINLIVNSLAQLEPEIESIQNLASFIVELSPEEKAVYFSKIKSELIDSRISKKDLLTLNELGFFKGQKQFLKELI